jgi:predicted RNase H-like HicB family nuclease
MLVAMSEGTHKHDLNLKIEKWSSGMYTAQVVEIPSIIVQAESKDKLLNEVKTAFEGYLKAFPEEHDKLFHSQEDIEYEHLNITV